MPDCSVNGIRLAYERHGPSDAPVICMVQGLGMTLAAWPPVLIEGLVSAGYGVLTLDNRDIGQSQLMSGMGVPNFITAGLKYRLHLRVKAPYRLLDMMKDTAGLLRSLAIPRAHVVGVSMGGMISQLLAIHEPELVASLTSIMSTTGNRRLPGPEPEVARHIMSRPKSRSREDRLAFNLKTWKLIGSRAYPRSQEEMTQFVLRNLDRGVTASGIARQTLAILASPSRVADLKKLGVPSLVIHGEEDRLVRVECGRDTAQAIPNAKSHFIPGMGHDLPPQLMDQFVGLISDHVAAAERSARTSQ